MDLVSALAIFVGAGCGALLRWLLGIALNPVLPVLPLGTLAANVLGGLLMGVALGMFSHFESLSPAARLALTTGFLGGLTTFSTFSGESVTLILRAEYMWATIHMLSHLALSLLATFAGLALANSAFQHLPGASP